MAGLPLNKNSLLRKRRQVRLYERILPSLDMKRRQLMLEWRQASHARDELARRLERQRHEFGQQLPMLANRRIQLAALVRVAAVEYAEENRLGVRLPVIAHLDVRIAEYSLLARPHWVDRVAAAVKTLTELRIEHALAEQRAERLHAALRKAQQRLNLVEKRLLPQARADIRRITVHLDDLQRSAVARSKLIRNRLARRAGGGGRE